MRFRLCKLVVALVAAAVWMGGLDVRADEQFTKLLIRKADKLYKKRARKGKALAAREGYEKALAVAPESVEARWKLARVLYWMGTHTKGKERQMEIFEAGIRYCQEAAKRSPDCVQCHFWLGVSYGKFGEAKGILQSLGLVPHIKEAMEKVLKLDEKFSYGGAHRVLGRLYNRLPALKGGDNDKAVEHLKKAIEYGPHDLMNFRFLAEVYLDMGKKEEAKGMLKTVIDHPKGTFYKDRYPESKEEQRRARKLWTKHWEKYW